MRRAAAKSNFDRAAGRRVAAQKNGRAVSPIADSPGRYDL